MPSRLRGPLSGLVCQCKACVEGGELCPPSDQAFACSGSSAPRLQPLDSGGSSPLIKVSSCPRGLHEVCTLCVDRKAGPSWGGGHGATVGTWSSMIPDPTFMSVEAPTQR